MAIRPTPPTALAGPDAPFAAWEFFAGGGLAGLGLAGGATDRAGAGGFRVTFANDLDAAKAAAWRANHAGAFRLGDVADLTPADLPGRAELAWASSPCQDLSLAGRRGGLGAERSGAFWSFWRLMTALDGEGRAPPLIVLENVAGLLSSSGGADFAAACGAMAGAGYLIGALEIDAVHWLPQSRPRLFVVAARGVSPPQGAGPAAPFHSKRIVRAAGALPAEVRAAWAWWSLPGPPRRNAELADLLDADGDWLDAARTAALVAQLSPLHARRIAGLAEGGRRHVGAGYRRVRALAEGRRQRFEVRFDGLAGCLRTPAGGSSRQYVVEVEGPRLRVRLMTAREAARLMGVDDDYRLPASESAALKLMGDAVAVPAVRALSEGLLSPALAGRRGLEKAA